MKKIYLLIILFFTLNLDAQIVINEFQPDAGNNDGSGGEWIELKNTGASSVDISCWRLGNGGSALITMPSGLSIPAGGYLLIGNKSLMMCATCDYHSLDANFTLTSGFGIGTGTYSNTVFLNTDPSAIGGCDCMDGSGAWSNNPKGDRVVLFDNLGTVIDAIQLGGGDNYTTAALSATFPTVGTCPVETFSIPAVGDPIYTNKIVCNDITGCNSSYSRLPDGNTTVSWSQTGNLACTGCTSICGASTNTASTDHPTPGLSNSTAAFTATLNGSAVTSSPTSLTVCGATPITFEYLVNNYFNASLLATQASGNLGSYTRTNGGTPANYTTANFNAATGVTTLSSTLVPATGTNTYEFVWGDALFGASPPGSASVNTPNNTSSTAKECFVYNKVTVIREDVLSGTPVVSCGTPGSITITGFSGTNVRYTLQKQSVVAGPFVTVQGPQTGNSFGGVTDDDADPALPVYQVLVSSVNTVCINPTPIVVAVPNTCQGNPPCPIYQTTGAGAPTFNPASPATVCAGSNVTFAVDILKACIGTIELKYDYNAAFDPYTSGTTITTVTGVVGPTPTGTINPKVYISEFQPRPCNVAPCLNADGTSPNSGEYVELYNPGPGSADIGGYVVSDGDWAATIPAGTILAANSFYLIGGGGTACYTGVTPDLNIETCNCVTVNLSGSDIMNLTNGNEQVALFDCGGTYLDGVLWGGGQSIPTTGQTAPASGCNNYIPSKSVNLPAAASFVNSGGGFSGANGGRQRDATGAFSITNNNLCTSSTFTGTPKALNTGLLSMWNGATVVAGTSCPQPPLQANATFTIPDTCSISGPTVITIKAIFHPDPTGTCSKTDVTAIGTYTIPPCDLYTLTGNADVCLPVSTNLNISVTSSAAPPPSGYTINLSNGTATTSVVTTGAATYSAPIVDAGIWTITSITPPMGQCAAKKQGSAEIIAHAVPSAVTSPITAHSCGNSYDLTGLNASFTPVAPTYAWYDMLTGGTVLPSTIITASGTYYVAASSGAPANCESARTAINVTLYAIPETPTVLCNAGVLTIVPAVPNCTPVPCTTISALQYSPDGTNWSSTLTHTSADPGWLGWGAAPNNLIYVRNASSPTESYDCENIIAYAVNPCTFPLPVQLVDFSATLNASNKVDLKWTTDIEINVARFEIEKSRNGIDWKILSTQQAKGNTTQLTNYTDVDAAPYNGKNYYRLKEYDNDGRWSYSKVVLINTEQKNTVIHSVYPNPAHSVLQIDITVAQPEQTELHLLDITGRLIKSIPLKLEKGFMTQMIDISALAKGNYIISLVAQKAVQTHLFTKE